MIAMNSFSSLNNPLILYYNFFMRDELESLKGQQVEVVYNGITYKGLLVGASEDEVDLQTREQWVSLPMEGITSVRKAQEMRHYPEPEEGAGGPAS